MRIAQIATLGTRVRQIGSGSIEGLVWLLARELTQMGHEVTVFAAAGSQTCGELVATLPGPYASDGSPDDWQLCEWINLARAVEQSARFDVLHSHAYLWGIPLQPLARAPLVHTTHVCPDANAARLWSMAPQACVTAISRFQWGAFPELRASAVIYHGVDETQFTYREEPADYACYLGRFTPGKGALAAVAAARELGLRLLMAGPVSDYFERKVRPLVDGRHVEYLGPIGGARRDQLLGGARVLLYPIAEAEPFGLVAAEAMTCGTPVAAVRLGAVAEVVDEGVTGCTADSAEGFPQAVARAMGLDRRGVRQRARERFSARRMAQEYLGVYQGVGGGLVP
jgi:glycosyltransferase involved in cell wall biosynthesis